MDRRDEFTIRILQALLQVEGWSFEQAIDQAIQSADLLIEKLKKMEK